MIIRSGWTSCLVALAFGSASLAGDEGPRVDQIQVIGSHNSYHLAPHPNVLGLLGERAKTASKALDYTHRPLEEQFGRLGLRQIELDVFADPEGGRYANPLARKMLRTLRKEAGPDPNLDGRLLKPGFKVFHIQDFDYQSTVTTFAEALHKVRDWSARNPRHVPILVQVELKDDLVPALPTRPWPFGKAELDAIDAEIRSVFSPASFSRPTTSEGRTPRSWRRSKPAAGPRSKRRGEK